MNNIWKTLSVALGICTIALISYIAYDKFYTVPEGYTKIGEIDREDYEYKKKQNPKFAEHNQDYFFNNETSIEFSQELYDFDTIVEGEILNKRIEFTNTGKNPFFILNIKVSCGCTVPSYEKKPVAPNEKGYIDIQYDSKNKEGFSMNKLLLECNVKGGNKSTFFKVYVKENKK